jgi:hypothetical protein
MVLPGLRVWIPADLLLCGIESTRINYAGLATVWNTGLHKYLLDPGYFILIKEKTRGVLLPKILCRDNALLPAV